VKRKDGKRRIQAQREGGRMEGGKIVNKRND
jgi:hypothetical protein